MFRAHFPPAFRYRPYRLLWFGLLLSIAGNRMQTAAVLWHINELSGQPIALGGVGLMGILPVLAFSLVAGAIADLVDRRRLMLITQGKFTLQEESLSVSGLERGSVRERNSSHS